MFGLYLYLWHWLLLHPSFPWDFGMRVCASAPALDETNPSSPLQPSKVPPLHQQQIPRKGFPNHPSTEGGPKERPKEDQSNLKMNFNKENEQEKLIKTTPGPWHCWSSLWRGAEMTRNCFSLFFIRLCTKTWSLLIRRKLCCSLILQPQHFKCCFPIFNTVEGKENKDKDVEIQLIHTCISCLFSFTWKSFKYLLNFTYCIFLIWKWII